MSSNHTPPGYKCPICLGLQFIECPDTLLVKSDMIYHDELVSAFINSFWIGVNRGHVIVVTNEHFENLYMLPGYVGERIFTVSQKIAMAMKDAYNCSGISIRQNNEPAGDQHAFHYHMHVFPRYENDNFNQRMAEQSYLSNPIERLAYAQKIMRSLAK